MREQRSYSSEAIILKHLDMGEADRILTLFTPYKGKFHAVAKGVRRIVSKKAGHLELLNHTQLQVAVGRNLDIITQAESIESFPHVRTDLWHMTCGFYLAELTDRFIEEDTQHQDIYKLLLAALRTLDEDVVTLKPQLVENTIAADQEHNRSQLLLRYYEIYLLSSVGYEPVLRTCAHCNVDLQPVENGFTPSLGGALCPNCSSLWAQPLSVNALKVMRLLQRSDWGKVPPFRLDKRTHAEMENAMRGLIRFHLERDLQSWNFLEQLR